MMTEQDVYRVYEFKEKEIEKLEQTKKLFWFNSIQCFKIQKEIEKIKDELCELILLIN